MASEKRDLPPHVVEDDESDINMDEKQATWSAIEVAGGPPPAWSKDDEGRIRRRLDLRVMPVIFILYLLCFIDR
jgi:hypothetical protein